MTCSKASPTPRPGPDSERPLARRFADAYTAADVDGVIALLTDDAWLSMPPAPHQYHGAAAIRAFLHASFAHRGDRRLYLVTARANTQPALASYLTDRTRQAAVPNGLFVLSMAGPQIHAVTRFHLDELYPRFGLPDHCPNRRNPDFPQQGTYRPVAHSSGPLTDRHPSLGLVNLSCHPVSYHPVACEFSRTEGPLGGTHDSNA